MSEEEQIVSPKDLALVTTAVQVRKKRQREEEDEKEWKEFKKEFNIKAKKAAEKGESSVSYERDKWHYNANLKNRLLNLGFDTQAHCDDDYYTDYFIVSWESKIKK